MEWEAFAPYSLHCPLFSLVRVLIVVLSDWGDGSREAPMGGIARGRRAAVASSLFPARSRASDFKSF